MSYYQGKVALFFYSVDFHFSRDFKKLQKIKCLM